MRGYEVVEQFDETPEAFATLVERAENDWIVLPKYPLYAALIPIAHRSNRYQRFAEFGYTVIYRKIPGDAAGGPPSRRGR